MIQERPITTSIGYQANKLRQLDSISTKNALKSRNALISIILDDFLEKYSKGKVCIKDSKLCLKK